MEVYWAEGFPPAEPLALAKWLVLIHTGQMAGYPLGSSDGGSTLTVLLALGGAWQFWRCRRRALLVLWTAPFVLAMVAAVMHRYPYGAAGRLSQHFAPAIILLAGAGLADLIRRAPTAPARRRWTGAVCGLLAVIGIGGTIECVLHPYRGRGEFWSRRVVHDLFARAGPHDPVVVLSRFGEVSIGMQWYLARHGARVAWNCRLDPARINSTSGNVWCLYYEPAEKARKGLVDLLARSGQSWTLSERLPYVLSPVGKYTKAEHCDLAHWVRTPGPRR
jgi:hypothetical protein